MMIWKILKKAKGKEEKMNLMINNNQLCYNNNNNWKKKNFRINNYNYVNSIWNLQKIQNLVKIKLISLNLTQWMLFQLFLKN